ncbi:MAG: 16S rRNA (uracil(1498)-N(3))-methyltransferase, partial [Chloroflexi bacterium]
MHRFFVPPEDLQGNRVTFSPEQAHQLRQVLRMQSGERVVVLDNSGWEYETVLVINGKQVTGELVAKRPSPGEPAIHLTLYQSLLRREKFEWVLQKCTEIGVSCIVPVITRRTLARETAVKPAKLTRWQKIVTEAAEQSRRGRIPQISPPQSLAAAMSHAVATTDLTLIPWEAARGTTIRDVLINRQIQSVALFIGPEGGFDTDEVENGRRLGIIPVTLGPRILRAETAALVASTLI